MLCPMCCNEKSIIKNSRPRDDHIWRVRECDKCGYIWRTVEIDEDLYLSLAGEKKKGIKNNVSI